MSDDLMVRAANIIDYFATEIERLKLNLMQDHSKAPNAESYRLGSYDAFVAARACVLNAINDHRAAHLGGPAVAGWLPIETAPKDGRLMLLVHGSAGHIPFIGKCIVEFWYDNGRGIREPTHWMPLPAAPDPVSHTTGQEKT